MANEYVNKVTLGNEDLIDLSGDTATAADVAAGKTLHLRSGAPATGTLQLGAMPYGECDSTSTATAFTATVPGITELQDGTTVMLKNGVVTSAANFTININNLGAKPCYNNMATGNDIVPTAPTRDTTIFNQNYTMLFVYSESIVEGGGWICYRGYDANTNTIGYQLRTNSSNMTAADTGYRYRIWLTSADGSKWVPINTSTSTNATTARTLNTRAIDPFGAIVYRATNGTCNANAGIGSTGIWQQYTLAIGYSYVLTLTFPAPVYLRCTPQANGSAVMNDIVQALPSSNDGKIYIFLGVAYSATAMELHATHPVYWHDGTGIRLWTGTAGGGGGSTVSVTQVQTTGTKIATITVDSVGTDLYAPSGGQPTAMTEQEVQTAVDNAWPIVITNLTGTTWYLEGVDRTTDVDISVNDILFTSNNDTFVRIDITVQAGVDAYIDYYRSNASSVTPYDDGTWRAAYRTLTFTGGTGATNASLIEWLQLNASRVS